MSNLERPKSSMSPDAILKGLLNFCHHFDTIDPLLALGYSRGAAKKMLEDYRTWRSRNDKNS